MMEQRTDRETMAYVQWGDAPRAPVQGRRHVMVATELFRLGGEIG